MPEAGYSSSVFGSIKLQMLVQFYQFPMLVLVRCKFVRVACSRSVLGSILVRVWCGPALLAGLVCASYQCLPDAAINDAYACSALLVQLWCLSVTSC